MTFLALVGIQTGCAAFGLPIPTIHPQIAARGPESAMAKIAGSQILTLEYSKGALLSTGSVVTIDYEIIGSQGTTIASTIQRRLPFKFKFGEAQFWTAMTQFMRVGETRRIFLDSSATEAMARVVMSDPKGPLYIKVKVLEAGKPQS